MSELRGVYEEIVLCMHNSGTFLWTLSKNVAVYSPLQFSFIFSHTYLVYCTYIAMVHNI